MKLRDYQQNIFKQVMDSTSNDMVQLDTGGGKTAIMAAIAQKHENFIAVAHRNILITQISSTLARYSIKHNIVATTHTKRQCIVSHRKQGWEFFDEKCNTRFVASIDSIVARNKRGRLNIDTSLNYLILIDEAHHAVEENKWGSLRTIFPNARFIGFTATPCRLDEKSLHSDDGGLFDRIVQADDLKTDSVNKLIARGYLSDFKVYTVESDIDSKKLKLSKAGDYTTLSLAESIDKSTVIGDAVKHYKKLADGKQAVIMCVSILNAEETANNFKTAGFSATSISSKMSAVDISRVLELFVNRHIQILCNVDMLGEGFDVPGIEAIIMLRKTASFVSYRQWIGRSLRPLKGKNHAIIIDHVANVLTHGMPDKSVIWDLKRPPIGHEKSNLICCKICHFTFKAWLSACPECNERNNLTERKLLGDYYIYQTVIDYALCESIRLKSEQDKNHQEWLNTVDLDNAQHFFGEGAVASACLKIRKWFICSLTNIITAPELNIFLSDSNTKSISWWCNRFTLNDLKKTTPDKCLKEFKKWQK